MRPAARLPTQPCRPGGQPVDLGSPPSPARPSVRRVTDLPLFRFAPGVRMVRRGPDRLQVGLYAGRRAVLPRTPPLVTALGLVEAGLPVTGPVTGEVREALHRLSDLGLVELAGGERPPGSVAVLGDLPDVDVGAVCRRAGLAVDPSAPVALVVSSGELDRGVIDPLLRRGTDHVVVRLVDGGAVLGPFTSPGRTACLRCLDAHASVLDPDHVPVTTRYVRASSRQRVDRWPEPLDPALAQLALAWAARDVGTHLAGGEPATWSSTVHLGPRLGVPGIHQWPRHPACACSWGPE